MTDRADLKWFPRNNCLHGDEDGRRGKVLRTSRGPTFLSATSPIARFSLSLW